MSKQYFSIALTSLVLIGSCKAGETQQSYKRNQRGYACIAASLFASFIGWSAWSTRDKIVGQILKDSDGRRIFEDADLFAWLTKVEKTDTKAITVVSNANIESAYTIENKLVPFNATIDYKIMLGIAGILGLYALYTAYTLFIAPQATDETDSAH